MTHLFITDSDFSCTNRIFQYLLGFQPTLGAILLDDTCIKILLDARYIEKTKNIDENILKQRIGNPALKTSIVKIEEFLPGIMDELGDLRELCCEDNIAIKYTEEIKEAFPDLKIKVSPHNISNGRIIKSQQEQEYIIKAIDIIDEVFLFILKLVKRGELYGKTELEVQGIIISKIFEFGGEGESFTSIVAFGKNSATAHHSSGDTIISDGPLLIDMGARYKGYCSDFTRTLWVGKKTQLHEKFIEISHIVAEAHEASIAGYKTYMTGRDLYNISKDIIASAGYDAYYTHGLGHGVGLDIHEAPKISKRGEETLDEGMVFTIEPGIYLPGEFGIRLEDIVFLKGDKLKKYSKIPLLIND